VPADAAALHAGAPRGRRAGAGSSAPHRDMQGHAGACRHEPGWPDADALHLHLGCRQSLSLQAHVHTDVPTRRACVCATPACARLLVPRPCVLAGRAVLANAGLAGRHTGCPAGAPSHRTCVSPPWPLQDTGCPAGAPVPRPVTPRPPCRRALPRMLPLSPWPACRLLGHYKPAPVMA
jgi:hypothetical protein